MNKTSLTLFFVLVVFSQVIAQQQYSLSDIINRAKERSPKAKQAETKKENRYWKYKTFKSNYTPQLTLSGSAPGIRNGGFRNRIGNFTVIDQISSSANFGIEQPLGFSGGRISINSGLDYLKSSGVNSFEQWNNKLVNIRIVQPLFAFNQLAWDKKIEPLLYEESKRGYVEEMELISSQAVGKFFAFLDAQINLQISKYNLANNDTILKIEQGRYNLGTTSKDKLLQVKLQLLRSRQAVTEAELDLQTAKLELQSYAGFSDSEQYSFLMPEQIPDFEIDMSQALEYAKAYRSDFIAFERKRITAESEVSKAKSQRFTVDLDASYGLNKLGQTLESSYQNPDNLRIANVRFTIPIVDWGRNKARLKTAIANQQLNEYVIEQDKQTFEQEIITLVRRFEVLRNQIKITKESDKVAQERYAVSQNRYLIGKIDITNLNIAITEKDNAKRSYLNALKSFWTAYYDLRRLTLYDFYNNKFLYKSN